MESLKIGYSVRSFLINGQGIHFIFSTVKLEKYGRGLGRGRNFGVSPVGSKFVNMENLCSPSKSQVFSFFGEFRKLPLASDC